MDSKEVILLKKALERQKRARKQAEKILEEKSKELYDVTHHLKETNSKLENLLNEKTSELDGVFINIIDPYVVMDLQFNVINMNGSAKEFLGYDHTKEHLNLSQLVHPDYIEYTFESFQSLIEVGTLKNYRAKIFTKDQSEKWVQINSSLIYDAERKPIAAQGIIRDITQESEIKELLSEQKKQLDIIVENSPLGIALTVNGKIVKVNKAFETLIGYSQQELKQMHVKDISTPEDKEGSIALLEQMNQGEIENFAVVKTYTRKDGTCLLAKTQVSAVRNGEGKEDYQVAIVDDITAQKQLELQKEKLLLELEASNQGLQEYAHIVSHDLKSPLRSINALSSWLMEDYKDVLDENGVFNLRQMQEKVESMDRLISGILKYSSVTSDYQELTSVDFNQVINEIKEIIFIPDHVQIKVPEPLPSLMADRTKIHQLFQNILSNAVVHIEREKGLVQIEATDMGSHWQFSIADNGVGIPKEHHERIFKIFQSAGTKEGSTGIGLSIVKKIIDLYQGKIWLESTVGKGTTFYFTLKKEL